MSSPYREIFVISLVALLTTASQEPENEKIDEGNLMFRLN
ncbi:hypothetical protein TcasGA2_TC032212 [Tribolium castaneum]|uniref:Uncharacterized protein n=1 Tax=Tribolium castaneum TaxID=7070 RepID=A0A139WN82_TRICA|nr:hypothetical protein TcasGA2_TC032212 [Tribolium castaneum]